MYLAHLVLIDAAAVMWLDGAHIVRAALDSDYRNDLNDSRTSSTKNPGCSHAAKRPPFPVFDAANLRKEWAEACHKLGLGIKDGWRYRGLTIHDLRRSAVRNLIRAGVREDVAMTISGHKTRAVFSRYNITDTTDVREALIKVGQYAKIQQRRAREA